MQEKRGSPLMFFVLASFVLELGAVLAVFTTPEAIIGLLVGAGFPLCLIWLSKDAQTLDERYSDAAKVSRR